MVMSRTRLTAVVSGEREREKKKWGKKYTAKLKAPIDGNPSPDRIKCLRGISHGHDKSSDEKKKKNGLCGKNGIKKKKLPVISLKRKLDFFFFF